MGGQPAEWPMGTTLNGPSIRWDSWIKAQPVSPLNTLQYLYHYPRLESRLNFDCRMPAIPGKRRRGSPRL